MLSTRRRLAGELSEEDEGRRTPAERVEVAGGVFVFVAVRGVVFVEVQGAVLVADVPVEVCGAGLVEVVVVVAGGTKLVGSTLRLPKEGPVGMALFEPVVVRTACGAEAVAVLTLCMSPFIFFSCV